MYFTKPTSDIDSEISPLSSLAVSFSIAKFLSEVVGTESANIPPLSTGNGQPDPKVTAAAKLQDQWKQFISRAREVLGDCRNIDETIKTDTIGTQAKLAADDREWMKSNSEDVVACDEEFPAGSIIHLDPYILQVKSSGVNFANISAAIVTEYFIPKFTLIQSGKLQRGMMDSWESSFFKAAIGTDSAPDTQDTDFPVDQKLWSQCRENFGYEGDRDIKRTFEPLAAFSEKCCKAVEAKLAKLSVTLVEATTAGGKSSASDLTAQGSDIKRYLHLIADLQATAKQIQKLTIDKYNLIRQVVVKTVEFKRQSTLHHDAQAKLAKECAALKF